MRPTTTGYTLLELVIVITICGFVLAIAMPRGLLMLDRVSVHAAASDVTALLASARSLALADRTPVAVDVDTSSGVLRIRRGAEMLLSRNVGQAHGVKLDGTRDSLAYDGRGFGHGAANLSIVLRKRAAVETVFVSRLGRVR